MLFGKSLGCHIIQFPSNRWGYVGTLPTILATEIPASTSAVLGGRAFTNAAGETVEWKFPSFATEDEARAFAVERGVKLA